MENIVDLVRMQDAGHRVRLAGYSMRPIFEGAVSAVKKVVMCSYSEKGVEGCVWMRGEVTVQGARVGGA